MDRVLGMTSSVLFGGKQRKTASHTTRTAPYGQVGSTLQPQPYAESSRAAQKREQAQSKAEQAFHAEMESLLHYYYPVPEHIAKRKSKQWDALFMRFYQETYPKKQAERQELRQQIKEKREALAANRERHDKLGPIAKWPGYTGAAVGLGVESAIHLSTMGVSAFVLPPGTVTAMGAVAGKMLGRIHSPEKLQAQINDAEEALEDASVYLQNLQAIHRVVSRRTEDQFHRQTPGGGEQTTASFRRTRRRRQSDATTASRLFVDR